MVLCRQTERSVSQELGKTYSNVLNPFIYKLMFKKIYIRDEELQMKDDRKITHRHLKCRPKIKQDLVWKMYANILGEIYSE